MVDIIFVSKQKKQQESFFFLLNPMALCTFLSFLKQIVGFSTIVVVGNLFFPWIFFDWGCVWLCVFDLVHFIRWEKQIKLFFLGGMSWFKFVVLWIGLGGFFLYFCKSWFVVVIAGLKVKAWRIGRFSYVFCSSNGDWEGGFNSIVISFSKLFSIKGKSNV